jgi:hypothetical protein
MRIEKIASRSAVYLALLALVVVLGVLFAVRGGLAGAQEDVQVATGAGDPRPKMQGVAVRQGDQLIMRAEDGQEILLTLGPGASEERVTRNSEHVTMNDIQDSDLLNVALNHDGTVYRLDALPATADVDPTTFQVSSLRRWFPLVFTMAALGLATLAIVGAVHIRRGAV